METGWWVGGAERRAWRTAAVPGAVRAFHQAMPGYAPTPLVEASHLVPDAGTVLVKDESSRLGLPAFKVLGVSWAMARLLGKLAGEAPADHSVAALRAMAGRVPGLAVTTATDGNHGRALAYIARLVGIPARISLPEGVPARAEELIRDEGASVIRIAGSYDDAVAEARAFASRTAGCHLVQDMGLPGYEEIPAWIVEGYTTLFEEIDLQLADQGIAEPGLVIVPTGVGSLLQAALAHYRRPGIDRAPAVVSVEPEAAACVLASVRAGALTPVAANGHTIMAGLNAGTPSTLAWPLIAHGVDAAIAITDAESAEAMEALAAAGVPAGPCGAASLAALRRIRAAPELAETLEIGPGAVTVLISTEGRESGSS